MPKHRKPIEIALANITRRLKDLGWSYTHFAKELGWSPSQLSDFMAARRSPRLDTLELVASTLRVEVGDLFMAEPSNGTNQEILRAVTFLSKDPLGMERLRLLTSDTDDAKRRREIQDMLLATDPEDLTVFRALAVGMKSQSKGRV